MRKLVDTSPSISSIYANASIANDAARAIAVALVDEVNAAIAGIPETEESNNISELIDVATRQTTRTKLGKLRETTEGINRFDNQTTLGQIEVFKKSIQASITAIDSTPRSMNIEIDAIAKSERDAKDAAKKLANHKKQIGMVADLCRNLQAYRDAPEPKPVQLREQLRNDAVITSYITQLLLTQHRKQ